MHRTGVKRRTQESFVDARRALVDYGSAVVHVLQNEGQKFCSLERLWKDRSAVELPVNPAHEGSQDGSPLGGRETTVS